jgi:large subunit ribosomal protein L13
MKTEIVNDNNVERKWVLIDAKDQVLGRMSTGIAHILKGKHKASYSPASDVGDYVVVINAEQIVLTGAKAEQNSYFSHSTYAGGSKTTSFSDMMEKKPTYAVEHAVKGMLPKNAIGKRMYSKLFVYEGSEHPHAAQSPVAI